MNPASGICSACDYTCSTCAASTSCTSCGNSSSTYRSISNGQCACVQGFYSQIGNQVCQPCHTDCLTCTGPTDTNCTICADKSFKNSFNQCACYQGFERVKGICTCLPGRIISGSLCIDPATQSACTVNQIPVSLLPSPQPGASCSCISNYFLIKGTCQQCTANSVFNATIGDCSCVPQFYQLNNGNCISCASPQIFDQSSQGCICPAGSVLSSSGACVVCGSKQIFLNNQCQCISGYIMTSGKCIRCTDSVNCPSPSI